MDTTFSVIVNSVIVVLTAVVAKWAVKLLDLLWLRPRKLEKSLRDQGLNGTPYRPFLGDLKDYIGVAKTEKPKTIKLSDDTSPRVFGYYHQILTNYGKNSFFWLGPWPRLNIADPELIKEILSKPDLFQQPLPETGKNIVGGLLFLQGQKWAKHRNIVNHAFHMDKLKNMVPAIGLSCSKMIREFKDKISSSTNTGWSEIDIWPYLEDLTGDIISRTAFGSNSEEGTRIFLLQREKIKISLEIFQLTMIPGWRYLPTKTNRKLKAMTSELQLLLKGIIDKRQKKMDEGEAIPNDLLGTLMESNSRFNEEHGNKNAGMSIDEVIDECNLFYFGGSRSTACLLVWTMVMLCIHPEWQTRAREEVNRFIENDACPSFESLTHLKTVTMILQEVLRLYSPIPLTVRGSMETVKLGHMTIPAGVHMTLLLGLLHRDPNIWGDDANQFKPERFSGGVSNASKFFQSSFTPFSSGPRICMGQNFVMIEAKVAMAMILRNFSFELSSSYLHAPYCDLTLIPEYGAPIILSSLSNF